MRCALSVIIAAAVALLSACGRANPPASTPSLPSQTAPVPVASVQLLEPSSTLSPAAETNCTLGYADGSRTFPDTADGLAAAERASNGLEPHMVMHVTITNSGSRGVDLHSYVIELDDPAIPETIQTNFNLSVHLAAGASWAHWLDMGTPDKPAPLGGVALHMPSESTLQLFSCRLKNWQ